MVLERCEENTVGLEAAGAAEQSVCVCFSASHSMAALPYAPFDSDFELSMLIIMHVPIISACTDDAI